jgi:hypothetical protein
MFVRAWSEPEAVELLRSEFRAANMPLPDHVRVSRATAPRLREVSASAKRR